MIIEELKKLYITHTGHEPEAIDELPSSGSNRRYFRLKGTPTLIGVSGESVEENRAFLYMAEHFRGKGLPVPEVFIRSEDNIYYLQEDLGDTLLFNAIEKGRKTSVFDEEEKQLLRKTMRLLPAVQNLQTAEAALKQRLAAMQNALSEALAQAAVPRQPAVLHCDGADGDGLRRICLAVSARTNALTAVLASGGQGLAYALCLPGGDVRPVCKALNEAFGGRGGGKPGFCQGSLACTDFADVQNFLVNYHE
mgnify:CR=1 FL=1